MRQEYTLSDTQLQLVREASKPVPVMYLSGGQSMYKSPHESANEAWKVIAKELGVVWDSILPVAGKPQNIISAVPL